MNRNSIINILGRDSFEAVGDEEADLEETKTRDARHANKFRTQKLIKIKHKYE